LGPSGFGSSDLVRTFAVCRVLRLVRLIRMVRLVPMFRTFWSLVQGVLACGRTLLYTYLIIIMVLYIFSIFAVYVIGKNEAFEGDINAEKYFGDVPKAMFTLFQVITLDSWSEIARPLMKKSSIIAPFFVVVIVVVTIGLLNLIVAVVVDAAFDRAKQDEALLAAQKHGQMMKDIKELESLFHDIDKDGSHMLSKSEYDSALVDNEDVRNKFEVLAIEPSEYEDIWNLLDEGTGEVEVGSFSELLRALKGEAKAKDTFRVLRKIHQMNIQLARLSQRMQRHRTIAAELRSEASVVRQSLGSLQHDMADFMVVMGRCVPDAGGEVGAVDIERFHETLHEEASKMF